MISGKLSREGQEVSIEGDAILMQERPRHIAVEGVGSGVEILSLPCTSCVALDNLLNLSVWVFFSVWMRFFNNGVTRKYMPKTISTGKLGKGKSNRGKREKENTVWPRKQNILYSWSKRTIIQRMEKECFWWWIRGDEKIDNDSLFFGEMKFWFSPCRFESFILC